MKLGRLFGVQHGEGRLVVLVVSLLLVAMGTSTVGASGVQALFFDRVGAQALPVMYLLQGGVTFLAMLAIAGPLEWLGPRRAYLAAPLFIGAALVIERAVQSVAGAWIYKVMWITVALATLLEGIGLWGTAGAVVDTRQAKRLFPLFGAGGILGTVIGGLVTQPLAAAIGTENLLLVWAVGLGGVFVLSRWILGSGERTPRPRRTHRRESTLRGMAREFAFVRRSRLLVWMTVSAVLFSVVFYLLYLPFARASAEHFPDPAKLAGFFGLFWAASFGAAFLVSIFATNRLFLWFGTAAVVIMLPVLYTAGFGILLAQSGFVALIAIRFAVNTWLQGVSSPGWETLVNVIPEGRRDQTRSFLNGGPTQVGTVIAGLIALGQNALTLSQFALIGLGVSLLTVIAAIGIRRSYATALVDALRTGRPQVFEPSSIRLAPVDLPMDAESVGVLSRGLRSPDTRERRLAFQLLAELPPGAQPPEVAGGVDDEDPLVRLAATKALDLSTPAGQQRVLSKLDDPDTTVAAAAAARALALDDRDRAPSRIDALLHSGDERVRRSTIEQLVLALPDQAAPLASEAVDDPAPYVRAAALEVLAATTPDRVFDRAIVGLRDPDPAVRLAAGRALGAAGGRAVEEILSALGDRRTVDAAVEAVRRVDLNGGGDQVRAFIGSASGHATRDRALAASIPIEDDAGALLRDAFLDRGRWNARSALWAATMLAGRRTEMEAAIESLDGPPQQVATALETLEATGDPKLLRPLLALWDPAAPVTHENDWLSLSLGDDDEFIRRCAEFIRDEREGGRMAGSVATLSKMERVLFLRKVPVFADVSPQDLERVAELVEERGYADGEVIASEGEIGDEEYIVIDGAIRVVQNRDGTEREVARRGVGDVVGELSLIRQAPRIASLVADGDVRMISLSYRVVDSVMRERPEIAMAAMRVMADRLAEASDVRV